MRMLTLQLGSLLKPLPGVIIDRAIVTDSSSDHSVVACVWAAGYPCGSGSDEEMNMPCISPHRGP